LELVTKKNSITQARAWGSSRHAFAAIAKAGIARRFCRARG
jgi:hypothetical protein